MLWETTAIESDKSRRHKNIKGEKCAATKKDSDYTFQKKIPAVQSDKYSQQKNIKNTESNNTLTCDTRLHFSEVNATLENAKCSRQKNTQQYAM